MIIKNNCFRNVCCDPACEPSRRDGSDEGSQEMVSMRNKKKKPSFITKYSQLSLSRLRSSRITAYLEEKIWSLF